MIDEKLLSILACPACEVRPPLRYEVQKDELICTKCSHTYKIKDGIPILLVEDEEAIDGR